MADHSKIGKEYAPVVWEVERGKIRELAKAIGDPNPIF
nr:MaoC family dehydratase N-terminal domain-containing protein [Deltaproteobacteria bacterium]